MPTGPTTPRPSPRRPPPTGASPAAPACWWPSPSPRRWRCRADETEFQVEETLAQAEAAEAAGPAVTPWVLARLHTATDGRSLVANRRLLVDNAGLAAEIAAAYYA